MLSKIIIGISRRFVNKMSQNYIDDIKDDFNQNAIFYQSYFVKKFI